MDKKTVMGINRTILGLLFIVAGLNKLFNLTPEGVSEMLTKLGVFAPGFFTWVLIIFEIGAGLALLVDWNVEIAVIPLILIMLVVAVGSNFITPLVDGVVTTKVNWQGVAIHLVITSNLWLIGLLSPKNRSF